LGPKIFNEILFLFNDTKEHLTATTLAIFPAQITAVSCLNFSCDVKVTKIALVSEFDG